LRLRLLLLASIALLLAACATAPPGPPPAPRPPDAPAARQLVAVAFADVPGWSDDVQSEAWPSFRAGCTVLLARPAAEIWRPACTAAAAVDGADVAAVRRFFEQQFNAYRVLDAGGLDTGLVTGYYEPLLHGSRQQDERNRYPLYAPPDDLLTIELGDLYPALKDQRVRGRLDGKRVVPYWPRADIDAGKAAVAGRELAFVDDPVDAFFLQIQGSGRIELPDGTVLRVGYADQNGQPYRSIGRVLVERGQLSLDKASVQGIKQWGRDHPDALPELLAQNPSYVFFREVTPRPGAAIDGPPGALGVPLAAGRTVAVDPRSIPLGAPVFVATTWPLSKRPLQRLMLAQDTGGAIHGAVRADWFWGFGEDAAREAGRMKQDGRIWLLWPRGAIPPKS
jgi:membrane-bound lytic murein transglycosylase A